MAFGSYINQNSNEKNGCVPSSFSPTTGINLYVGVKTAGACNNDILASVSDNGGSSFTGTNTDPRNLISATFADRQKTTDQFWQWIAFGKNGKLAVSYYDRQYGNDETTGYSDISVSGYKDMSHYGVAKVTTSSMPPPTQFSGVFYGDYTGLTVVGNRAFPIWMDTRSPEPFLCPGTGQPGVPPSVCRGASSNAPYANDQDIYTQGVEIPLGDR